MRVIAKRAWPGVGLLVAVVWAARRVHRVEVVGDSMRPTLDPGDRLVLWRGGRVRPGDLVALADPRQRQRTMVKRLAATGPDGLTVLGDNPAASTDSRTFGPVPAGELQGRVVYRYHPPDRRRGGWR